MLWYAAIGTPLSDEAARNSEQLMRAYTDTTCAIAEALRDAGLDVGFVQKELVQRQAAMGKTETTGLRVYCCSEWAPIAEALSDRHTFPEVLAIRLAHTNYSEGINA